ncbi:MAG: precorrin-3B C(17)-methyltransferase [Candidatus Hydrothermarchaeales archaeon]
MGKLFIVGLGPGSRDHMTGRAIQVLKEADVVVGYKTYTDLLGDLVEGKEVLETGMKEEIKRAKMAVERARDAKVALVSSGDPGVYAMGSIVMEYLKENDLSVEVEVVPGVTSANAAAALLGSPLGHDHASISLSDLLTPWEEIENRIEKAAKGDFVIMLYNPRSKGREWQLEKAVEILKKYRPGDAPVGIVRRAMRNGEEVEISTIDKLLKHDIDMLTIVIIGNSETFEYQGWMVTPRGYKGRGMKE